MGNCNLQEEKEQRKARVTISGLISLIIALLLFSGVFTSASSFLGAIDFTNLVGSFGTIGDTGMSFRGSGGLGAKDGFLFAITFFPAIMTALGLVRVVRAYGGLECAAALLTPVLRFTMGVPGIVAVTLVDSLSCCDSAAALTRGHYEAGEMTADERDIFVAFQFPSSALITNYFASGPALFGIMGVASGIPLAVCFITKLIGANVFRFLILPIVRKKS